MLYELVANELWSRELDFKAIDKDDFDSKWSLVREGPWRRLNLKIERLPMSSEPLDQEILVVKRT